MCFSCTPRISMRCCTGVFYVPICMCLGFLATLMHFHSFQCIPMQPVAFSSSPMYAEAILCAPMHASSASPLDSFPCNLVRPLAHHVLVWVPLHAYVFLYITGAFVQPHALFRKLLYVVCSTLQPPYSYVFLTPVEYLCMCSSTCRPSVPTHAYVSLCIALHLPCIPTHSFAFSCACARLSCLLHFLYLLHVRRKVMNTAAAS